jgi:CDP-diacylglycerol--glycerol-3-phosphate 3-phosphatidyltransferase
VLRPEDLPVNWPNLITLSRVPALFVVVVLLFVALPWAATAAFVVFVLGGITDWLDGYLARRFKLVSNFGKLMDALTDKVLIVGLMIAMLVPMPGAPAAILPDWALFLVLLIFGREFLITGLRLVAASQGRVLAAEKTGKIKTVLQLVSVAVLLLAHALTTDFHCDGAADDVQLLGLWLFGGAAILTIISGVGYLVKYWDIFMGNPSGDAGPT